MILNCWKARLFYGLVLWASGIAHHEVLSGISNSPVGMFIYHITAAITDYMLLLCVPSLLCGRLAESMQQLCLLSMIVNFTGWVLYMAYVPPMPYNYAISVTGYVQYAILFTAGIHGLNSAWQCFICGANSVGPQLYNTKEKR